MKRVGELTMIIMDVVQDISQSAAYKRAHGYLEGRLSRDAMFRPVSEKNRLQNRTPTRPAEIQAAVPGLSLKGAATRLKRYNDGLITLEQLTAPFGVRIAQVKPRKRKSRPAPKRGGNPEWWSLSNSPRRSPETISLGTWEQEQLA